MLLRAGRPIQSQGGDELLQVPKYDIDNFEYVINMTNTCKDVNNQPCHGYLTEYSRSMGHLGPTCNSYQSNMITQEASIISQMENDGFTVYAFLAFIHPNPISQFQGFYTILTNQVPNLWCPCPEPMTGPIRVSYTFKTCHNSFSHGQIVKISSEELADAKQTHQNLLLDQKCQKLHKCSYEYYITKIIDELTEVNHREHVTQERCQKDDKANVNDDLYAANPHTNIKQASSIPPNIEAHVLHNSPHTQIDHDISIPDKKFGFLNHQHPTFQFIGPDREPVHNRTIEEHLHIAEIIRQMGVPNYVQARIPIASGLNLEA